MAALDHQPGEHLMFDDTERTELVVPDTWTGQRLDQVAAQLFVDHSRSQLCRWIRAGLLLTDGRVRKPSHILRGGERLLLEEATRPPSAWQAAELDLRILYEDPDVLVIDKPAGLVVHPGAGNPGGTLVNGLLFRYPELQSLPRCGIVHRLDKDTSGLLVVARSLAAHGVLAEALAARLVLREYWALVVGNPPAEGIIEAPIGRHPVHRQKMAVIASGRPAITRFRVVESLGPCSLLQVRLETGRTHQIRVHVEHRGFPLLGDPVYGPRRSVPGGYAAPLMEVIQRFPRQALHARRLALRHPIHGTALGWLAPVPEDMHTLLTALGSTCADAQRSGPCHH